MVRSRRSEVLLERTRGVGSNTPYCWPSTAEEETKKKWQLVGQLSTSRSSQLGNMFRVGSRGPGLRGLLSDALGK